MTISKYFRLCKVLKRMPLIDKRSLNHKNLLCCFQSLLASNVSFLDKLCKRLLFHKYLVGKFVASEILKRKQSELDNCFQLLSMQDFGKIYRLDKGCSLLVLFGCYTFQYYILSIQNYLAGRNYQLSILLH